MSTIETEPIPTGSLIKGFSAVDLMKAGAKDLFDINVPPEVSKTWHSLMNAINHLDASIDGDYGYSIDNNPLASIQFLAGEIEHSPSSNPAANKAIDELKTDIDASGLEDEHKQEFVDDAVRSLKIDAAGPEDDSVISYAEYLICKGGLCGWLFADVVPNRARNENFPALKNWLFGIAAGAEVFDGFCDVKEDFDNGKINFSPTLANKLTLACYAYPELGTHLIKTLGTPKMAGRVAVKTALIVVNRSGRFNKYRVR